MTYLLPKGPPSPNTITFGVRASTYGFQEDTSQLIALQRWVLCSRSSNGVVPACFGDKAQMVIPKIAKESLQIELM